MTSLINKLEELGIGHPSTYSKFIEKNLGRGYIKKGNINGFIEKCMNFNLNEKELIESTIEKRFCEEKENLIIDDIPA
jgi:DNA topoisomerase IA